MSERLFENITLDGLDNVCYFIKEELKDEKIATILLTGDMGAGKTTFTSRFINLFGKEDYVNSPTFNIWNVYKLGEYQFYHFDLYRLEDKNEIFDMGFEEIWGVEGISIIEWWQRAENIIPKKNIEIIFDSINEDCRNIRVIQ